MRRALISIASIASAICAGTVQAKPMMPATVEEAAQSPHVVVASYQSFQPTDGQSNEDIYFSGITANYKLESILKGSSREKAKGNELTVGPNKNLRVRFIVHDLTPCMVDESFRFSESLMPSKGSRWILFLNGKNDNQDWDTYRGSEGRLAATEANIKKVKALIFGASPTNGK